MKYRTLIFILIISFIMIFVSCTTKSSKPSTTTMTEEWWNYPPADTEEVHYEVGFAKGSNIQTSRDWAKANVNQALAQYVSNTIDSIVTTYVDDGGEIASNNMQSLQAFKSASMQKAQATLTGVKYKYQQADDGMYVLAELPIGTLAESFKETLRETFVRNDASLVAQEEMSNAIEKYFK